MHVMTCVHKYRNRPFKYLCLRRAVPASLGVFVDLQYRRETKTSAPSLINCNEGKAPSSPDGPFNDLGSSKMRLYK